MYDAALNSNAWPTIQSQYVSRKVRGQKQVYMYMYVYTL
jgi:hypothetical protein